MRLKPQKLPSFQFTSVICVKVSDFLSSCDCAFIQNRDKRDTYVNANLKTSFISWRLTKVSPKAKLQQPAAETGDGDRVLYRAASHV